MTEKQKAQVLELHREGLHEADISYLLQLPQPEIIRAIAAASKVCEGCHWRRDGRDVCLLPACLHHIKV